MLHNLHCTHLFIIHCPCEIRRGPRVSWCAIAPQYVADPISRPDAGYEWCIVRRLCKSNKSSTSEGVNLSVSLSLSLCEYECVSVYLRVYTFVFLTIDCHYSVWYTASRERARILPNSEATSCLHPSRYIRNPSPPTFRHSCNDSRGLIFAATQSIIEMLLSTCT